jgi:hypothetical protein
LSRIWQDSLAWSLQGIPNTINPYYFIAGKAGKYQRLNYDLNALATYRLWRDQLYLASGINYFYNTASGSIDASNERKNS